MSNSGKNGVVTLGGREFKRVKNGVDEAEIGVFIDELIKERDELARSQHHISSLTKLAENTIVEADRMANQIKEEAAAQAEAEKAAILGAAEDQAQKLAEERQAEVLEVANEKANAIRAEAEKQTAMLLEKEKSRVFDELRDIVNQQFGYLVEYLDGLKQQATDAQTDFENKVSEAAKESITMVAEPGDESASATGQAEDDTVAPVTALEEHHDTAALQDDSAPQQEADSEQQAESEQEAESGKQSEPEQPSEEPDEIEDQSERGFDLSRLLQSDDFEESTEPQFEVEILPPISMTKIMEVVAHLDRLPEVSNTEIIPRMDSPSILVFLREEIDLVDALRSVPAVEHVEEVASDLDASNGDQAKTPRKVRVGLSGNKMSQEKK